MKIKAENAGKRFNREWIFRHFSAELSSGNAYAITGPNGSGKSTLLQLLSGYLEPTEGSVSYENTTADKIHQQIALAAPYLELVEEFTALEMLQFQVSFKSFFSDFDYVDMLNSVGLGGAAKKQIRNFSSGMKQRLKLLLAFYTDSAILLLDEPCTNLDREGFGVYKNLVEKLSQNRLVIVCSNDPEEYQFCTQIFNIADFK